MMEDRIVLNPIVAKHECGNTTQYYYMFSKEEYKDLLMKIFVNESKPKEE